MVYLMRCFTERTRPLSKPVGWNNFLDTRRVRLGPPTHSLSQIIHESEDILLNVSFVYHPMPLEIYPFLLSGASYHLYFSSDRLSFFCNDTLESTLDTSEPKLMPHCN